MGRGTQCEQFKVGQRVKYITNIGHSVMQTIEEKGKMVEVFSHKNRIPMEDFGTVAKIHKSGRQGVAEIYPEVGSRKISRKLQHVTKA